MSMMIFSTLFFLGIFIMFFFILRGQDILLKTLRSELAQTKSKLSIIETRLASLMGDDENSNLQDLQLEPQKNLSSPAQDTTLHLNMNPLDEKKS